MRLLAQQTHRVVHRRVCGHCFHTSPFIPIFHRLALDMTGLQQCGGYFEKRLREIFAQYVIKIVTLYRHPTQVLIILLDNVPGSVTTISSE